jgi:hypothetical protein
MMQMNSRALMFGAGLFLFVVGVVGWVEIPPPPNMQYFGETILHMIFMIAGGAIAFLAIKKEK